MEWSDDLALLFIGEVERKPILWDSQNPFYKITRKKTEAWDSLGQKFKTSGSALKSKWLSLLASYRREKGREIKQSGIGVDKVYRSGWFAYTAMHFVGDRYKPRDSLSTAQVTLDHSVFVVKPDIDESETVDSNRIVTPDPDVAGTNSDEDRIYPSTSYKRVSKTFVSPKLPPKKIKEEPKIAEAYDIVNTAVVKEGNSKDEFAIYGEYVASQLRKLDKHSCILAQHHINTVILNANLGRYELSKQRQSVSEYFPLSISPLSSVNQQSDSSSNSSRFWPEGRPPVSSSPPIVYGYSYADRRTEINEKVEDPLSPHP